MLPFYEYITSGIVMAASGSDSGVKPLQNAMKMAKVAIQLDAGNRHKVVQSV